MHRWFWRGVSATSGPIYYYWRWLSCCFFGKKIDESLDSAVCLKEKTVRRIHNHPSRFLTPLGRADFKNLCPENNEGERKSVEKRLVDLIQRGGFLKRLKQMHSISRLAGHNSEYLTQRNPIPPKFMKHPRFWEKAWRYSPCLIFLILQNSTGRSYSKYSAIAKRGHY